MNSKYDFGPELGQGTVYIRRVSVSTLPQEVRDQLQGLDSLYAVHDTEGERLALVKDRGLAFVLARQNELTPVSVH